MNDPPSKKPYSFNILLVELQEMPQFVEKTKAINETFLKQMRQEWSQRDQGFTMEKITSMITRYIRILECFSEEELASTDPEKLFTSSKISELCRTLDIKKADINNLVKFYLMKKQVQERGYFEHPDFNQSRRQALRNL